MIRLQTLFKRREAKFDSAYDPPPSEVLRLRVKFAAGAVVIIGLCLAGFAMHQYGRDARLNAPDAEQSAAVAHVESEQIERPKDRSQAAEAEAIVSHQSTPPEISDRSKTLARPVGKTPDQSPHKVLPNQKILAQPLREEQSTVRETELLSSSTVARTAQPKSPGMDHPLSPGGLAEIAPGSGLAFPDEFVSEKPPLVPKTSPAKKQIEMLDKTAWRIQLASLTSETEAEAAWVELQQANPDLLENLSLRIQQAKLSKGTFYRVQAGPLAERSTAAALCAAFKSRNQDCLIVSR